MSDFIRDLEGELLAAARRRATRRRVRLPRRPLLVLATTGAVVLVVTVAVALRPTAGEPVAAPPGGGVPAAQTPHACSGPALAHPGALPDELTSALGVLARPRAAADALPLLSASPPRWLPVGDWDGSRTRRLGDSAVWLIPTADLRTTAPACGGGRSLGAGACLLVAGPVRFRCFTLAEIRAGRAFALFGATRRGARLLGLVADGREQALVRAGRGVLSLRVAENLVQDEVAGLGVGDAVALVRRTPSVVVLNATRHPGLATEASAQLSRTLGLRATVGNASRETRGTVVYVAAGRDAELAAIAAAVARVLGGTVAAGPPPYEGVHADVEALLGTP